MVETHRDCLAVSILQNIIKDVKTSDIFNEIEQLINEMIEIIGKIRQNRETNSCAVTEQKIVVGNEIRELRTRINNHLDKLQDDLMKELTETENQITDETRDLIVSLDEKQKELTEYQANVVNIKKYASDLQTYLAVQQIEKEVETHDTCLQALVNSNSLNTAKLSYRLDAGLKTITTSIQKFGEVIVESKPCELTFARKKDKQAQLMVADLSPPISVDNIQLNLKQKINIKGRSIRGCSFLPDSRIVLSCYSTDTISFINKEGVELFQIDRDKIGSDTYDTVYIKDSNSFAVSSGFGRNRCINIIDIVSNEVLTTISMDTDIVGMAIRGGTIYYCAWEEGLKKLSLSDNSVSDIINRDMTSVYYVATSEDKLYYTNNKKHTVTCCDLHGTTPCEFKGERVLQYPRDISVDNDGNVYVVGYKSNNVVVISPDGQRHIQLSSSKDGLVNPCVLEYVKSTNGLLVVNEEHNAFLFDVTRKV
jgi:WD40 repeat protein